MKSLRKNFVTHCFLPIREKISGLNQGQDDILRAKEAIDLERENLNMDKKSLANLRSEHSRLKVY